MQCTQSGYRLVSGVGRGGGSQSVVNTSVFTFTLVPMYAYIRCPLTVIFVSMAIGLETPKTPYTDRLLAHVRYAPGRTLSERHSTAHDNTSHYLFFIYLKNRKDALGKPHECMIKAYLYKKCACIVVPLVTHFIGIDKNFKLGT